ncbi:MAG TPA: META domain-containing protein [Roseiflexaceae bacterium]|nr:META domain-containing protein [Roseiflexaceae bacterium]
MWLRIMLTSMLIMLAACGVPEPAAPSVSAPTPESTETNTSALVGTEWRLVAYGPEDNPQQPLDSTTITLKFIDTQVSGSLGCNSFGGDYTVNGQQITFSNMVQTLMACPEPIMQQEDQIVAALRSVTTWAREGDTLRLGYDDGFLRFTRMEPEADRTLEGTPWQLTTFVSGETARSLLAGTSITATFADGRVAGSAGCNSYIGTYTLNNGALMVSNDIITTRKACAPDVMQQEQEFLQALAATTSYTIEGTRLTLSHPGGQLVFTA